MFKATGIFAIGLALAGCGGGEGETEGASLVAAGDSITLQSGACAPGQDLASCRQDYWPHPERSFVNFIEQATDGAYRVAANAGRSGDTCLPGPVYTLGPFTGENRGLTNRLPGVLEQKPTAVSVLIGLNDVNGYGIAIGDVVTCIVGVWSKLDAAGVQVIAMTYPPLSQSARAWAQPDGVAAANAQALNEAVRTAWASWAQEHPGGRLVDSATAWNPTAADVMTVDGVHPTVAGAQAIAATWR